MVSNGNIIQFNNETSIDICKSIADRVKIRRLELNLTQSGIASRAGVNIETYRKFERKGEISLQSLVKLAFALDSTKDFNNLFIQKQYQSLDELLESETRIRKRGKKT
jgi:transcriptional regulator with XRE-family HTH domain